MRSATLTMMSLLFLLLDTAFAQSQDSSCAAVIAWAGELPAPGAMIQTASSVDTMVKRERPTVLAVGGEVLLGGTMGGIGGFLVGAVVGGMANSLSHGRNWDAIGYAAIGAGTGYVLGSALGVHTIARKFNPSSSYVGTLICGAIGIGSGIAIFSVDLGRTSPSGIAPVLLPVICEVVFVNLLEQSEPVALQGGMTSVPLQLTTQPPIIREQRRALVTLVVVEL